jgi:hypothetical protein
MRVFLWILREVGAKDVPSFDHLRQVQKGIREEYGIPSIPCKSPLGNVFFINDPWAIIAQVGDHSSFLIFKLLIPPRTGQIQLSELKCMYILKFQKTVW